MDNNTNPDPAPAPETTDTPATTPDNKPSYEDLQSSYDSLQQRFQERESFIGRKGVILPKEGDAEDLARYYKEIGVPEKPEEYQYEVPEGLPIELDRFQNAFHKHGLTPAQAKGLLDEQTAFLKEQVAERKKVQGERVQALRDEWGKDYDANIASANELITKYAKETDSTAVFEELERGLGDNPALIRFLVEVAKERGEDDTRIRSKQSMTAETIQSLEKDLEELRGTKGKELMDALHPEHKLVKSRRDAILKKIQDLTDAQAAT